MTVFFSINGINQLIIKSAKPGKLMVTEVSFQDILDFKNWHFKHYKKFYKGSIETKGKSIPKENKTYFPISSLFHFVYDNENKGCFKASAQINCLF